MIDYFPKALNYLNSLNYDNPDPLDIAANVLIVDENKYEKASQAFRRRFTRGYDVVDGIDRGGRPTKLKRERKGNKYGYFIQGIDGNWVEPEERIWVVAMYFLWQKKNSGI